MFFALSQILALPLAFSSVSFAAALPTTTSLRNIQRSIPRPWCDGLGGGAFDEQPNLSLAAYNTSLPNANSTGAPIVLGQAGAIAGAEFKTYASYPYNDFPTFSLDEGALVPKGAGITVADTDVLVGGQLGFVVTNLNPPTPAQIYCALASTDPMGGGTGLPVLAVHGDPDSFSLCRAGDDPLAQTNVVYQAQPNNTGYIYDSCYPVRLQIIPL
ncbi:unnamed protein product [Somion occarium]|uniref:Uncharacterized protein n=1 Tax=Somion occarium TaxID=3059160 RepID=A0ABP1D6Q0_9APHY